MTLKFDLVITYLHLWSSGGDGFDRVSSNGVHSLLELVGFDGCHIAGLGDFQFVLFTKVGRLRLASSGQAFQFRLLGCKKIKNCEFILCKN